MVHIVPDKKYAVVTGDIIGSKRLSEDERRSLFGLMKQGSNAVRQYFPAQVPLDIAIARGDEWQLLVEQPVHALRVALYYRAALKAGIPAANIDTRFAIGIGTINFIPGGNVTEGVGEAFNLSGKSLDGLAQFSIGVVVADEPHELFSLSLEAAALLVDTHARGWTAPQAQAVCGGLLGWTQKEIAEKWPGEGITQQAVSQHFKSASWPYVERGLDIFEDLVEGWV